MCSCLALFVTGIYLWTRGYGIVTIWYSDFFLAFLVRTTDWCIFSSVFIFETIPRICVRCIADTPYPENLEMVFIYSTFLKGDHTYFDIEPSSGVEGTQLYPHLKYTTISEHLDNLL